MTEIPHTFLEFISSLNKHGVRFLLIGGFAVSIHGSPRTTTDIDFWIAISSENADATIRAIHDFGFVDAKLKKRDLLIPGRIFQMGREPMRIDILTAPTGVEFDLCMKNAMRMRIGGVSFNVISRADLVKNKLASGRLKDLQDVETLTRMGRKSRRVRRSKNG